MYWKLLSPNPMWFAHLLLEEPTTRSRGPYVTHVGPVGKEIYPRWITVSDVCRSPPAKLNLIGSPVPPSVVLYPFAAYLTGLRFVAGSLLETTKKKSGMSARASRGEPDTDTPTVKMAQITAERRFWNIYRRKKHRIPAELIALFDLNTEPALSWETMSKHYCFKKRENLGHGEKC